ncbi:hypothetical protein ACK12G_20810 [Mycolicibacterium wolinskyi]|uniref:hypothetical protein n=1 Tax=Mycolicibacterium wolinskyi TaxID=59750 RepID=UPI0039178625
MSASEYASPIPPHVDDARQLAKRQQHAGDGRHSSEFGALAGQDNVVIPGTVNGPPRGVIRGRDVETVFYPVAGNNRNQQNPQGL